MGPARPKHKRLGKIQGAMIDALDVAAEGELPLEELYDVLKPGRRPEKRWHRDLRQRQLPMLEEAEIVTVREELVVKLTDLMYRKIPVSMPRGDGLLWRVFSDEVGVL